MEIRIGGMSVSTEKIFKETLPFCMAKLALGVGTILLSAGLLIILLLLRWMIGTEDMSIAILIWVIGTIVIRFLLMHYVGYLVKAAHVAVITEIITTGSIPVNQVEYGKRKVIERFEATNTFFVIDKLMNKAIRQIQRGLQRVSGILDIIPGVDALISIGSLFIQFALSYIDECCLGYIFYKKEEGSFKSAADGVAIYAQNWKELLKGVLIAMLKAGAIIVIAIVLIFMPMNMLFKAARIGGFIPTLLAIFIAWVLKEAILDSYIMIEIMADYFKVATRTEVSFDMCGNLCSMSTLFKELYNKGLQERPMQNVMAAASGTVQTHIPQRSMPPRSTPQMRTPSTGQNMARSVFCKTCGSKNDNLRCFSSTCGSKLD